MGRKIAIDGPAGAGKSTVAKSVAKKLGYVYVDTGAMFRALALHFLESGLSPENKNDIIKACRTADISVRYQNGTQYVYLNGSDVTDALRAENVGEAASAASVIPEVRSKVLLLERQIAEKENVVMEGRDIGTQILPDADLKLYLTADASIRAKRRFDQLKEKGVDCDLKEIRNEIDKRDERDKNREYAPLKHAENAILIDTSCMTAEEAADKIILLYRQREKKSSVKVIRAKSAGFCFGVKRAVDTVCDELKKNQGDKSCIYTYGPIIHNAEVVASFKKKGVRVIDDKEDLKCFEGCTVIIRSHGVSEDIYERMRDSGINIVDATCPFVKKIHQIVKSQSEAGKYIVIIGDADHPEVQGIQGWAKGRVRVIKSSEEAEAFSAEPGTKICIVSQTTFNYNKFQDLVEIIKKKSYDITVLNTICNATKERQDEARAIADKADAMIVIGDKYSSNTRKLFEICRRTCHNTYYIQTPDDLDLNQLESAETVGITAGASTPDNIIEEVQIKMSDLSFEQMLDESFKTIHSGEVVKGTVIGVKPDEIILNIGYKADGIITKNEYTNDASADLESIISIGDTIEARVLKVNDGDGQVLLTYKRLAIEKGNERLKKAFENKEPVKGKVIQILGGGICAAVEGVRVFIPASLVADYYEKDLNKFNGREIEFVIIEYNPRRNRFIGDRRQLLAAEKQKRQEELFASLKVGDVLEGVVKNITDFGAFVDLGGADGLLHISEMSWGRVDNPRKLFHVGDKLNVLVKDIHDTKVALSLKFPETNPWANAAEDFAPGSIITGRVARMTNFGAFVELVPGVDALLHVSQISRMHVDKPSDVLSIGQMITAKIVDLNQAERKISLSMKALDKGTKETTESDPTD